MTEPEDFIDYEENFQYQFKAIGTYGNFRSGAGDVQYLLTTARVGSSAANAQDFRSILTSQLVPVREALDISGMDFNQLLQRDLDDHRVATKLIPYILETHPKGPAFFPSIVAALLPFDQSDPKPRFASASDIEQHKDEGLYWRGVRHASDFSFEHTVRPDGERWAQGVGRIRWNPQCSKLIVIDGQHRAMALLAIVRTLTNSWGAFPRADRYKSFYEKRVTDAIDAMNDAEKSILNDLEFPVTIVWVGEKDERVDCHEAARKLFVDVNKNARAPSEARLILLSDTELKNIFTRAILNKLRSDHESMPISGIEYDYPGGKSTRPRKWSALISLEMLVWAIKYVIFGPKQFILDVTKHIDRYERTKDEDKYMRSTLEVLDWLPPKIEDGDREYERGELGNENFPSTLEHDLVERFMSSWGSAILYVSQNLLPLQAHINALKKLDVNWDADDKVGALARDAVFEGVGLFWTLRDSFEHWKDTEKVANDSSKPDIILAWESIQKREKEFQAYRCEFYLGSAAESQIDTCNASFRKMNTNACYQGVFLTLATLSRHSTIKSKNLLEFVEEAVETWNTALSNDGGPSRLLILCDTIEKPLNLIQKMDTPDAGYFRYFWLELLVAGFPESGLAEFVDKGALEEVTAKARLHYLNYLVNEESKALKRSDSAMSSSQRQEQAIKVALKKLGDSLVHWFDYQQKDIEDWAGRHLLAEGDIDDGEVPQE